MSSGLSGFPFGIMDVVELLHLRVRRRQPGSVYVDCPFCNDRRGKMNVNYERNVWRCNYCDRHGGMLALYAECRNTTNSAAYREICDAIQAGDISWESSGTGREPTIPLVSTVPLVPMVPTAPMGECAAGTNPAAPWGAKEALPREIPQPQPADPQEVHKTYFSLLEMLVLRPVHREHLRSGKRGLSDGQIERFGFKSTPPFYLCRTLAEKLLAKGCTLEGVPGFYQDEYGCWTARFNSVNSGILIPCNGIDGMIRGFQILLDTPLRNEDDPPGKKGAKYIWLSSSGKKSGTTSGSPVHFVGDPAARTVYVTEGILKADIAHCLMNRSFAAVAGVNNVHHLGELFARLKRNGTELIVEAYDMDKFQNAMVMKGVSKVYLLARQNGLECRSLTWDPGYKGIDDWQLALCRRKR